MKKKMRNKLVRDQVFYSWKLPLLPAVLLAICLSCKDKAGTLANIPLEHHDAQMSKPDGSLISIDAVPNSSVMRNADTDTGSTRFYTFRVGIADSLIADKKQEMVKQRYYDFEMEQDWIAVVNGDSMHPVFFHPQPQKTQVLKEFIMVFELPAGWKPDTLIYKDRARREINTVVLNRK
jgi:hypothetical protein